MRDSGITRGYDYRKLIICSHQLYEEQAKGTGKIDTSTENSGRNRRDQMLGGKGDDNAFCGIVNDVRGERRDRYGSRQPIESLLDGHRKHSI